MERMTKGNKVHLEGAKAYGPQDYEVVDEMKILEEENKKLKEELSKKNMETWFDEKAKNIYINQRENILMGKIC